MRHIGFLPDQARAARLKAWLLTRDMACDVEAEDGQWSVWIHDEDHIDAAREEFLTFNSDPDAERYRLAEQAVKQQQRAEARPPRRKRPTPRRDPHHWTITPWRQCPVTVALIVLSVLLTAVCVRSLKNGGMDFDMNYEPVLSRLLIVEVEQRGDELWVPTYNLSRAWTHLRDSISQGQAYQLPDHGVGRIVRGEYWRLVTPIFLHFGIFHIVFNLMWMRMMGCEIEARRGSPRYLGLVLLIAVVSNVGQYAVNGSPVFGGMSGVVYGVFGYLWMKERYEPSSGMSLPPSTALWMIGWFVFCWTGLAGPIANWAHTFGLATGMLVGLLPTRTRSQQSPGR